MLIEIIQKYNFINVFDHANLTEKIIWGFNNNNKKRNQESYNEKVEV